MEEQPNLNKNGGYEMLMQSGGPRREIYEAFNEAVLKGVLSRAEVEYIYKETESLEIDLGNQTEKIARAFSGFRIDGNRINTDKSRTYMLSSTDLNRPWLGEVTIRIDKDNIEGYKTPQILKVEQMIEQFTIDKIDDKVSELKKILDVLIKANRTDLDSLAK